MIWFVVVYGCCLVFCGLLTCVWICVWDFVDGLVVVCMCLGFLLLCMDAVGLLVVRLLSVGCMLF